jgi:hypothetical protein
MSLFKLKAGRKGVFMAILKIIFNCAFAFVLFGGHTVLAGNGPFQNLKEYKLNLGYQKYYSEKEKKPIRVAILSESFLGYEKEIGKTLPTQTTLIEVGDNGSTKVNSENGLRSAQIVTSMVTDDFSQNAVNMQLILYSFRDEQAFKWVVGDMVEKNVDLILYVANVDFSEKVSFDWINYAREKGIYWVAAASEKVNSVARHPEVITVSAVDAKQPFHPYLSAKPDLLAPSLVQENSENYSKGGVNASALVASGVALVLSTQKELTLEKIFSRLNLKYDWSRRGLSLQVLRFHPTGPGCFWTEANTPVPSYAQSFMSKGAQLVQTTAGLRLMVPFDPIYLKAEGARSFMDDMITLGPTGFNVFRRWALIPSGEIEVFQTPQEAAPCRWPGPYSSKFFKL